MRGQVCVSGGRAMQVCRGVKEGIVQAQVCVYVCVRVCVGGGEGHAGVWHCVVARPGAWCRYK